MLQRRPPVSEQAPDFVRKVLGPMISMIVANSTGCSSIYGGNLPTTPWTVNAEGPGLV